MSAFNLYNYLKHFLLSFIFFETFTTKIKIEYPYKIYFILNICFKILC